MTDVRVSVTDGLGRIVLCRPPLNILTVHMLTRLRAELEALVAETSLRVLLLSAEGEHFSAGADVREHLPPDYRSMIPEFLQTVAAIDAFPLPVIAAVQGRCLGGGFELVLPADLIVAGESAQFGQPEIALGVAAPAACALLPRMAAPGVVAELLFMGDPIGARGAERAGIVRRVVPDDELERTALDLAERIARHSAAALRVTKRMVRRTRDLDWSASFALVGALYCDELMATADAREGLRAFVEKRRPVWSHQ